MRSKFVRDGRGDDPCVFFVDYASLGVRRPMPFTSAPVYSSSTHARNMFPHRISTRPHAAAGRLFFRPIVPQELRDVVLGTPDALEGLLLNIMQPATPSLQRNCVWALSNMCRGKPQPETDKLRPALPVLLNLLSSTDEEVSGGGREGEGVRGRHACICRVSSCSAVKKVTNVSLWRPCLLAVA